MKWVRRLAVAAGAALRSPDSVLSTGEWSRIVAIGDIHGDKAALQTVLRAASVVDSCGRWIAEPKTLVLSCGDVLDRGTEDWQCLRLLQSLKHEAMTRDSDVAMVLGNHELMNLHCDMRFVPGAAAEDVHRDCGMPRPLAFNPGAPAALLLAELCGATPVARKEGDSVFVHAALLVDTDEQIDVMNHHVSRWLVGEDLPDKLQDMLDIMLWTRLYQRARPGSVDPNKPLPLLPGCSRVVAGHNVQLSGINPFQRGQTRVYRIDTGMSRFVAGGRKQVLELRAGCVPKVLEAARNSTQDTENYISL